ncbi:unnamed protein product [Ilex paraguariensis]|uniref:Uncharacterized protein n=1 Tax=Ilex paraguariensis TaxID=185542 RepID=A0ABC8S6N7_9AQUA
MHNDLVLNNRPANNLSTKLFSGVLVFKESSKDECGVSSYNDLGKANEIPHENVDLIIDKSSRGGQNGNHVALEKKKSKEKCKATNSKKAPKPPRPPTGLLLDATDMKLVKEISELAMKKRARIEHMKLIKKMKATKPLLSSNSTLSAMVDTLVVHLIITFQDCRIWPRNSSSEKFHGFPRSSAATNGLISVQFYNDLFGTDSIRLSSKSTQFVFFSWRCRSVEQNLDRLNELLDNVVR